MGTIESRYFPLTTGQRVIIRHAVLDDARQMSVYLNTLWNDASAFNITAPGEKAPTAEEETAWIQAYLDNPAGLALVAAIDGMIIGLLDVQGNTRQRLAHVAEMGVSLVVGWRDKGIGRMLIGTMLDWATAHPVIEKIELSVLASNSRAIHVYHLLGFAEEGRRCRVIKFEDGTYDDLLQMACWIT